MRRSLILCLVLAAAAACSDGTGPGGVPRVVGAWCSATQVTTVSKSGSTWSVQLFANQTEQRDVPRSDGVLVRQEVRSCMSRECQISGAPATWTADDAVAHCRQG